MDLKKLQAPLERQLALLGFELLCVELAREGRDEILRLYLDHSDAEATGRKVTLDDCTTAHEGLLAWLDVEFPDLREHVGIEVSSPGMERPLVKADHFRRFAGRLCRLQTLQPVNGQKRFKGWIGPVTPTTLTLEEDGVLKEVPLEALQKARLAPFDESKTPKPKHLQGRFTEAPDADGVETSATEEEEA
ncbi:ribosome maturation factor RimP [Geothrix rubra]|uniref:Ribosome maturation factor RimP n=1 Tax=Geothrix rubra TaxID=2927977 RepID=A0ABQ5Q716_9BACT|nr:ribosome maturation factor RimP [Geothrix rubra]GLH70584.1 ribosome maturation factor RimP [Geothrix rubra]